MRKLIASLVILAVLVAILAVADVVIRHRVERAIAQRIESSIPGATARVRISSSPFVGRLLTSGTVVTLHAEITGASVGAYPVDSVNLAVQDLKVSRSDLLQGRVVLRSIRLATATAAISQQSVDTGSGLPVTLGAGTLGLGGLQVPATVSVQSGRLRISASRLPVISVPLIPATLLPCTATAVISPALLTLSCTTTTIPAALVKAATR